jgi:hypothetical protein
MMSKTARHDLILEAVDPSLGCVVADCVFAADDLDELLSIVDPNGTEDDLIHGYDLDHSDLEKIIKQYGLEFDAKHCPASIRAASETDKLPYKVHTGRELKMMLDGVKPFAYFYEEHPKVLDWELPERFFEPYVESGKILKREYVQISRAETTSSPQIKGTRYVLYALASEQWRIEAFILLNSVAQKVGWSEGFERMLGSLLGYEEWQNDIFIERAFRSVA